MSIRDQSESLDSEAEEFDQTEYWPTLGEELQVQNKSLDAQLELGKVLSPATYCKL